MNEQQYNQILRIFTSLSFVFLGMKWNWSIFVVLIGNFLIKKWFIFVCLIVEKKFRHNNIFSRIKVYIASHVFILKCIACVYFLFLSKLNKWNKIWAYWELKWTDIKCIRNGKHWTNGYFMQWNDLHNKTSMYYFLVSNVFSDTIVDPMFNHRFSIFKQWKVRQLKNKL